MNQLNQFMQQMRALFSGMTPQTRLMAALLSVGIVISCVFLVQGYSGTSGALEPLFGGQSFSDTELRDFEIAFSNKSLRGYELRGTRVYIPTASKSEYYTAISDAKVTPQGMGAASDGILKSNDFMESSKSLEAKHRATKNKELANNLKQMNAFIQDANITYDEQREGFSAERRKVASIAIKTKSGRPLTSEQKRGIILYIEKSYAGLKQKDIALMDLSDARTMVPSDDPSALATTRYYDIQRQREDELRQRAELLLTDFGDIRVDVNVELDTTLREETEQLDYKEKPTNIQSTTFKKDSKSRRPTPQGRPGAEPNALANTGAQLNSTNDQTTDSKETTENLKSVTGNTLTRKEIAGLQTRRVRFSVSVPFSYYRKAFIHKWQEFNPGKKLSEAPEFKEADQQTLMKETELSIQNKIKPILPIGAPGEDSLPKVEVTYHYDMPVPELPSPSTTQIALNWLAQSWQTLALLGIVGIALVSLRSFAKTAPGSNDADFERGFDLPLDDATDIDLSSLTDEESDLFVDKPEEEPLPPRLRTSGGDLKSDLTSMVRENPDAAATLLRNWISGNVK
jgi:flagellar M-ring protein FliF